MLSNQSNIHILSLQSHCGCNAEIKQIETEQLVKKLSTMLVYEDEDHGSNSLTNVVIKNIKFGKTAKDYLVLMFGYNNQLFIDKDSYHLSFV